MIEKEIKSEKELMKWLKDINKEGYSFYAAFRELVGLINNVSEWYKIKYNDYVLDHDYEHVDVKNLYEILSKNQQHILNPLYRCETGGVKTFENAKSKEKKYREVGISSLTYYEYGKDSKDSLAEDMLVLIDVATGAVLMPEKLKKVLNRRIIKADDLLALLSFRYKGMFDFEELRLCCFNHECDVEILKMTIKFILKKIIDDKQSDVEHDLKRADIFITDFKEKIDKYNLEDEINNILNAQRNPEEKVRKRAN